MKDVNASLRYLRIAPRKVRLVVDSIRGRNVRLAERDLQFNRKLAALPVLKLLRSAIANAEHNFHLDPENLFIKHIVANEGPTLKRYRPRAFGSAAAIRKRTSHVMLVLGTTEKGKAGTKKKAKNNGAKTQDVAAKEKAIQRPDTQRGKNGPAKEMKV